MRQMHGVCGAGMRSSKMICAGDNRVIENGGAPALCLMWRFWADGKLFAFYQLLVRKAAGCFGERRLF